MTLVIIMLVIYDGDSFKDFAFHQNLPPLFYPFAL